VSERDDAAGGLSRRALLAGLGATAAVGVASGAGAQPANAVKTWDITTDVLIAGSGAAGVSAAIEARQAGAQVLMIESLGRFGGSSAMSGGVIYAGGGTLKRLTNGQLQFYGTVFGLGVVLIFIIVYFAI